MINRPQLAGIIPPILTPTDEQDRVDEPALRASMRRQIDAGVHGLFVSGTAGEGPLLVEHEWRRLAEIVMDEAAGRLPLLIGVQDASTAKVVNKVRHAREVGYKHFVLTPSFYIPARAAEEHLRLFGAALEAGGDMELIGYNIPQVTGSVVAIETFCEAAKRGWMRYCKESSGDLEYFRKLIRAGADCGLTVFMGDDRNAATGLKAGAIGLVNLGVNVTPEVYVKMFAAHQRHDEAEMDRCQQQIIRMADEVVATGPCFVSGPKYVLARLGMGRGTPVSPLEPASAAQKQRIDKYLAERG